MKKTSEKIVFFGSGPVAAESLKLLVQDFDIEAVVTKPRPLHHKGEVPVLALTKALNLPVLAASNKDELNSLFSTNPVKSRLAILIDFGIIISQEIIAYFPLGIINSHFSILPEWRGADPITFAILSGQKQTGVSIMLLVETMDEGPLLGYGEYDLPADITTPKLTAGLIKLSHALLVHDVPLYVAGNTVGIPQSITGRKASYSRKLTKADGIIDWNKPAAQIEREIRAFIEWPKSRTMLGGKEVIITQARVIDRQGTPGTILEKKTRLVVACGKDSLEIIQLKPAGKSEMTIQAFLAGYGRLL